MTSWWEYLLVAVMVGLALLWAVRGAWRHFRSGGGCSGCGPEGGCGSGGGPEGRGQALVQDLAPLSGSGGTSAGRESSVSSFSD
ncbi:hypothetical protein CSB20_03900 [bacterium DOLZORAL124_64_63]|nr:MAG: hypothetical protein CSB20_03900 [bacterium DOLZORAL124_64_63]